MDTVVTKSYIGIPASANARLAHTTAAEKDEPSFSITITQIST